MRSAMRVQRWSVTRWAAGSQHVSPLTIQSTAHQASLPAQQRWLETRKLEHYSAANAVLPSTMKDQARCRHVLTGMPHRLVDGELVFGLPPQAPTQQDLA